MQFWPHDDEHMSSKHVETWNKLIVKQKFCAYSSLITKLNHQVVQAISYIHRYEYQNFAYIIMIRWSLECAKGHLE